MASTVTASTLTVTITENIVLNGQTYGNSISKSYTSQGEVDQRNYKHLNRCKQT